MTVMRPEAAKALPTTASVVKRRCCCSACTRVEQIADLPLLWICLRTALGVLAVVTKHITLPGDAGISGIKCNFKIDVLIQTIINKAVELPLSESTR